MQKNYSKMNLLYDVATYNTHSNSKYSNFQQKIPNHITSDYGFLLRLVNTFTIDTEEYYLICYKVNDTKTSFKNLVGLYYIILGFVLTNQPHNCRLARLTGWSL